MSDECLFCRISRGELPSTRIYEDDEFLAFEDINPAARVHILVIPKKHIARLSEAGPGDRDLLGGLLLCVGHIARERGIDAFRLVVNDGAGAGQTVFHLHAHILSGDEVGAKLL